MSSRIAIPCLLLLALSGCDRQAAAPEQAATPRAAAAASPASEVDRTHKGQAAPEATFADPAGRPVTLATFRGKPVLVNLWATWCAPCIAELPMLNALAASRAVRVIAVSQDLKPQTVAPFLEGRKLAAIEPYTDGQMALSVAAGANLPTTILLGADGRERWRVTGAFDWTSAKAKALLADAG